MHALTLGLPLVQSYLHEKKDLLEKKRNIVQHMEATVLKVHMIHQQIRDLQLSYKTTKDLAILARIEELEHCYEKKMETQDARLLLLLRLNAQNQSIDNVVAAIVQNLKVSTLQPH